MKDMLNTLQTRLKKIEADKSEKDKLQGRIDQALVQLTEKFGCESLEIADEKYDEQKDELDKQKTEITNQFAELNEKYEW